MKKVIEFKINYLKGKHDIFQAFEQKFMPLLVDLCFTFASLLAHYFE